MVERPGVVPATSRSWVWHVNNLRPSHRIWNCSVADN